MENIFDFSFLVKQGTAALTFDDKGLPQVMAKSEKEREEEGGDDDTMATMVRKNDRDLD